MEDIKQLSDDICEQIKDFIYYKLTEEQESLINKLILDETLKECYKKHGLCDKCKQPKNNSYWCRICKFQRNFKNWTSGNNDVDKFIQKMQLKAKESYEILEWIEHDRFENIKYLAKGGFGIVYKAVWKGGRFGKIKVALKCLHNSQDITADFLREVCYFF